MSAAQLAEKCARARALMEEAQRLVDEVLDDPGFDPAQKPEGWPRGVCPDGVYDYLQDAIGMLTPEPDWEDDEPPKRPQLRIVASR